MKLAFALYKYFPFGGLQRDFLAIAEECHRRGHEVSAYVMKWSGDIPSWLNVTIVPVKAWSSHTRNERYTQWLRENRVKAGVDLLIGFNKMPDLDVYFAADPCYAEKLDGKSSLYRRTARCRHFLDYETSVFGKESNTQILTIARNQATIFEHYHSTPKDRIHNLPPGIADEYRSADNRQEIGREFRREFGIADDEFLMTTIGSGFKTKGLDRALEAIVSLPEPLRNKIRFLVVGQDNPRRFLRQARKLGLQKQLQIFSGRSDVRRFMYGANLMLHPAYFESAGKVLLEAIASGLPVLVTDSCGYAHYIDDAEAGLVVSSPFSQENLNQLLLQMINTISSNNDSANNWSGNGIRFAASHDIYSQPKHVADFLEQCSTSISGEHP